MTIATAPTTQSADRRYLLTHLLVHASWFDTQTRAADRRLRLLTGLAGRQRGDVNIDSRRGLDIEESLAELHKAIAGLHATLAPVALEWISELPDAAVEAVTNRPEGPYDAIVEMLPRLFTRAGISKRFRTIQQHVADQAHTFAPEEPR